MAAAMETLTYLDYLSRRLDRNNIEALVAAILLDLNIPEHQDGFGFLKRGILLFAADPDQAILKGIYSDCGQMGTSRAGCAQVEHSIRYAIGRSWESDPEAWARYFPAGAVKNGRPSNGRAIARIAYLLRVWQGFYEGEPAPQDCD